MQKISTICIFGDSTAWGAWDIEKGGWVNRLWLYVGEKTDGECDIYNLSISGGTTQTILDRFEAEAKIRGVDALIFQSGGNDACLLGKDGPNQIPLDQFKRNLEKIIGWAKNLTTNIVFVGFDIVDEAKTTPVPWGDFYYTNAEIEKYNKVMSEVCQEQGTLFLDIFNLLTKEDLEDGLHPNTKGHEKTFIKARDFLERQSWF
ncbi:MAG: GDSL-type esterase/lipase family protein [Candidatus Paceibacterota bacterium]|jgi:lysophospholipase L1-like esterase